jgi:hypothetical protein
VTDGASRARWFRWLPILPVAAGIVLFAVLATRDDQVDTIEIHSDAPVYQSLGALVAASDLIVVGEATSEAPGRAISAPADPDAAFATHLIAIQIDEIVRGQANGELTVEEIQSLADGTPVRVDGQPSTQTGERLLLFLVHGDDYFAIVNGQGRYVLSDTDQIVGPSSLLPIDWTLDELRQLAGACLAAGTC